MEREGQLDVWPYSVRRETTVAQRRLQAAREFVAREDNRGEDGGVSVPSTDASSGTEGGGAASLSSSSVQFMAMQAPELTDEQKAVRKLPSPSPGSNPRSAPRPPPPAAAALPPQRNLHC